MLATTDDIAAAAATWLAGFEHAIAAFDEAALRTLFHRDSHWRDLLALSWRFKTVDGGDAIVRELKTDAARARPRGFMLSQGRTPPRRVQRTGTAAIEAIFDFETVEGRGDGVLRLTPDASDRGTLRAWTLHTALQELKGHEEKHRQSKPQGKAYARDFHGPNWLDDRKAALAYADRDPDVLVVGAGQAGLSIAARLVQLDVDTLIVDQWPRIGDNWRNRYHALVLHNQVHVNHLPYMPFPPTFPVYIPKDKVAAWFETYADSLDLNVWTATTFEGGRYDEAAGRWSVTLRRADGTRRAMRPRHVVMATGLSGSPVIPEIPTFEKFRGTVLHSSQYTSGEKWRGKPALIIGSGNSGHDIAQDLHACGARATLVQRGTTMIVNVEPSAQLPYALYDEGPPLEDCDLITTAAPLSLARASHIRFTEQAKTMDRPLLDALERKGFRLDDGEDGTGWQFKYLTRGGGYYFNVGCSDLIANGEVGLLQFADIGEFTADGVRLRDGRTLKADLIVLATGYKNQNHLVRELFGDAVADRIGPVWGFGADQELRNMFARTAQPGLWFIAGSFAQCRIYSKYLGLQIKACEVGLLEHHPF
jgi:cation diffusion facilitator CzcD-associated flavoprotein CzcO